MKTKKKYPLVDLFRQVVPFYTWFTDPKIPPSPLDAAIAAAMESPLTSLGILYDEDAHHPLEVGKYDHYIKVLDTLMKRCFQHGKKALRVELTAFPQLDTTNCFTLYKLSSKKGEIPVVVFSAEGVYGICFNIPHLGLIYNLL